MDNQGAGNNFQRNIDDNKQGVRLDSSSQRILLKTLFQIEDEDWYKAIKSFRKYITAGNNSVSQV